VRKANDVAGGRVRLIFVAEDNPLWLRGIYHRMEEPILDELQRDLVAKVGKSPQIH
jgi:hypothetical protein